MKSIMNKLLATAAVSAILSFAPIANDAHALGGEPQDLWHGFYLGGHAGWAWVETDLDYAAPLVAGPGSAFSTSIGEDDFSGGFQAGINHQMGMLVVGLEADITFLTSKDNAEFFVAGVTHNFREDVDFVGTVRGRIGAAVANAMLYFTGGYAFGQVDHEFQQLAGGAAPLNVEDGNSGDGYALGGGAEIHLGTIMGLPMSAKIEYLHIDLEDTTLTSAGNAFSTPSTMNFDNEIDQVRVGINVQLGGM